MKKTPAAAQGGARSPAAVNLSCERRDQTLERGTKCIAWREERGPQMKKVLFALVATLVAVSVSGCAGIGKGKGKAPPPPPIVRKG